MIKPNKNVWAIHNGETFVNLKYCGIPELIVFTDDLPLVIFSDDKRHTWLKVTDCLAWFEKELVQGKQHGDSPKTIQNYEGWIDTYSHVLSAPKVVV